MSRHQELLALADSILAKHIASGGGETCPLCGYACAGHDLSGDDEEEIEFLETVLGE